MYKLIMTHQGEKGLLCLLFKEGTPERIAWMHPEEKAAFGDIYRARVQRVAGGMKSAFLELGEGLTAHMSLHGEKLKAGQEITVQIDQESFGNKLPGASGRMSLPGILLVLTGEAGMLAFSHRGEFDGPRREAIYEALSPYLEHCGFVLRTAAQTAQLDLIRQEGACLHEKYHEIMQRAEHIPAPARVAQGEAVYVEWIKNCGLENIEEILCDQPEILEDCRLLFKRGGMSQPPLKLWEDELSLGAFLNLEKIKAQAINRQIWLKSGAYLVLDQTEAMTVIDVNSGKDEKNASAPGGVRNINQEAAREVARQLMLRNLSGMIMVDFINMESKEEEKSLLDLMRSLLDQDPVYARAIDITPLGIMEITRRRVRRPLSL